MRRILLNDGLDSKAIIKLEGLGYDVDKKHYDGDELREKIKEVDCIVIRSATKIRKELIDSAIKGGNLKLIIRGGVGVDNIDTDYAGLNGITVKNTPNASSASVAELILAHMFSLARFLNQSNVTMKARLWNKKQYVGTEISGKTLGIIGMGRIGKELAKRCTALGMKIVYFDMVKIEDVDKEYTQVEFDELLKMSDFISLNISGTKNIIGSKELSKIKKGAFIINTSRGKALDEEAVLEALENETLGGVGLDVFNEEPSKNIQLINHPKASLSPHIGASTKEAQERIGEEVIEIIESFFS
ncbi:D-2-hydroxyacid dehydrogenase [Clostridium sp. B9]|uniref:D-2-hydroxyacid dehydrogenase n=1 Tax=Clostridium sp. B9 TaxID=3423224 RepID=UPI003D2F408D